MHAEETEDYEDWLFMEGEGLTVEVDAPRQHSNPALPERSALGGRRNIVSEEQIQKQGSLDLSDTLRNVPGVIAGKSNLAGTTTGASLYVRGRGFMHPATEVVTYFDGVPRFGFIYGQSMADGIPVNAIGRVEVYKSPQPVEFGAGYALINIAPRSMEGEGWTAEGGFSGGSFFTFSQNAAFGLQTGRFDIFAAQSWMSTIGHAVHSGARQQSYYLNTGFGLNPNWELRLLGNYVGALTEQAPRAGQSMDDILSSYRTNSVFSTLTLNNEFSNANGFLKLYYNNTQFTWLDENPVVPGEWSLQSLQAFGVKAREELTVFEQGTIVSGMDLDWMLMVNEDHNITSPTIITTFPAMIMFSPYAGVSWQFGSDESLRVTPSAGIRAFFHRVWANQLAAQGALSVGRKNLDLHVSYARALVYPAPAILQGLLRDSGAYQAADLKSIQPEKIDHFEAGITFAPQPRRFFSYVLDASYFFNDGRNRIIRVGNIPGNASSSSFKLQGLELAASAVVFTGKQQAGDIELFAGGTWYTSVAVTDEQGNIANRMPFTPVFSLSAGFSWTFLRFFNISGDFNILHNFYTGTLGLSPIITAPPQENRLRDIYLLNMRLAYEFASEAWRITNAELFFSVNNVFHYQYEYFTGYIMPGITFMTGFTIKW